MVRQTDRRTAAPVRRNKNEKCLRKPCVGRSKGKECK